MNRLAQSHSPYLLQHQHNPVDWFPWCDEAFDLARETDRPVFLSVGYAACHWCHVMEHESFENVQTAAFLNKHFVCIKVDREERPDIDQVYMNSVQIMSGRGGWPMSVFLNYRREPFYAGTYWPPTARHGMPGFMQVLDALVEAWTTRRSDVETHAAEIRDALIQLSGADSSTESFATDPAVIEIATDRLIRVLDRRYGGFGNAPKFPHATDLQLLLTRGAALGNRDLVTAATFTLDAIAAGGIRDHIGGGFARYSVDAQWLVPHFEKMLYDNALLALCYTRAFQITDEPRHAEVTRETLEYLQREMVDPSGGFHCSEDADSEGIEGKYYVWSVSEIRELLGNERAELFCRVYDVTERGNFEGHNIPNLLHDVAVNDEERQQLRQCINELYDHRLTRVRPGRDDKILTSWNALAIQAFAVAGGVLDNPAFISSAVRAAEFMLREMTTDDHQLRHAFRNGVSHVAGFLEDYAYSIEALIALFEATANAHWLEQATYFADQLLNRFQDESGGGFFFTAHDGETLIARNKDWHDGSLVSGNASAAMGLLKLASLCDRNEYRLAAERTFAAASDVMQSQAAACAGLLTSLDRFLDNSRQWVLVVPNEAMFVSLRQAWMRPFEPRATRFVIVAGTPKSETLSAMSIGKESIDGKPTLYRCEQFVCDAPLVGDEVLQFLRSAGSQIAG